MLLFSEMLKFQIYVYDLEHKTLSLTFTVRGKYLEGENIGEFDKFVAID